MPRHLLPAILLTSIIVSFCSCKKDSIISESIFYGKWKTSYGDTVTFTWRDGKNRISYAPGLLSTSAYIDPEPEFAYRNGKLWLNENSSLGLGFRELHSFTWVQEGTVFTVQNSEWFPFLSSMITYTFTRI